MQPSVFLLSSAACAMKNPFPSQLSSLDFWVGFCLLARFNSFFLSPFSTTVPDLPVYCKPLISAEQVPRFCLPWWVFFPFHPTAAAEQQLLLLVMLVIMVKWTEEGGVFFPAENQDGFSFLPPLCNASEDKEKPVVLLQDMLPVGVSRLSCLASSAPTYCINVVVLKWTAPPHRSFRGAEEQLFYLFARGAAGKTGEGREEDLPLPRSSSRASASDRNPPWLSGAGRAGAISLPACPFPFLFLFFQILK